MPTMRTFTLTHIDDDCAWQRRQRLPNVVDFCFQPTFLVLHKLLNENVQIYVKKSLRGTWAGSSLLVLQISASSPHQLITKMFSWVKKSLFRARTFRIQLAPEWRLKSHLNEQRDWPIIRMLSASNQLCLLLLSWRNCLLLFWRTCFSLSWRICLLHFWRTYFCTSTSVQCRIIKGPQIAAVRYFLRSALGLIHHH